MVSGHFRQMVSRALAGLGLAAVGAVGTALAADVSPRPNIVFIGTEDMSADLGCYGEKLVHTPNLDRLASQGAMFTNAYAHAPVCSASRSGMITGMYPTSIGTHHHRSKLAVAPRMFTHELRDAGYYVRWPGKTDFNFDPPADAFDSTQGWLTDAAVQEVKSQNRPFFLHINFQTTHEGQVFNDQNYARNTAALAAQERVDPAEVKLPQFYPDAPEIRRDLARYFELITAMDKQVGDVLDLLERNGLAQNTIVVFWGDHGRGLPRHKRWCYRSGTRIPLIVRWPGRIAPGTVRDDLVSVVDLAPTFLTVAGAPVPQRMQGQTFLTEQGAANPSPRQYVYSARDRMDETFDRIRAVHDGKWQYIRNFRPEIPYAAENEYEANSIIRKTWNRLNEEGKLAGPAALFYRKTKPAIELYDMQADPDEVVDLSTSQDPAIQAKLQELSSALDRWTQQTGDLGAVSETQLIGRGTLLEQKAKSAKATSQKAAPRN